MRARQKIPKNFREMSRNRPAKPAALSGRVQVHESNSKMSGNYRNLLRGHQTLSNNSENEQIVSLTPSLARAFTRRPIAARMPILLRGVRRRSQNARDF